jgi:hypothetical protein
MDSYSIHGGLASIKCRYQGLHPEGTLRPRNSHAGYTAPSHGVSIAKPKAEMRTVAAIGSPRKDGANGRGGVAPSVRADKLRFAQTGSANDSAKLPGALLLPASTPISPPRPHLPHTVGTTYAIVIRVAFIKS